MFVSKEEIKMDSKNERKPFINILRIIAMCCVFIPHVLAYRIDTMGMRYFAHYGLNRLHIIQFCGALGVSLFFITSGYLTMPQMGSGNLCKRVFKQILSVIAQVFVAMMFCMVLSNGCSLIFNLMGSYESYYAQYSFKDWILTGTLFANLMKTNSTEAVLWFLIPFMFFKLLIIVYDALTGKLKKREEIFILSFTIISLGIYFLRRIIPDLSFLTERLFYIRIIMIGYIFALLHKGIIDKKKFMLFHTLNIMAMLIDLALTWWGIDDGYMVSVLYATVIFYIFYKLRDYFKYNIVIKYFDKIGMPFYLLHNCVGYNFIQLFFYAIKQNIEYSDIYAYCMLILTTILTMLMITIYTYSLQSLIIIIEKKLIKCLFTKKK